jgi:hypothetical protein
MKERRSSQNIRTKKKRVHWALPQTESALCRRNGDWHLLRAAGGGREKKEWGWQINCINDSYGPMGPPCLGLGACHVMTRRGDCPLFVAVSGLSRKPGVFIFVYLRTFVFVLDAAVLCTTLADDNGCLRKPSSGDPQAGNLQL